MDPAEDGPDQGNIRIKADCALGERRVVGWSMNTAITAQFATDALVTAIRRRGKPNELLHHSIKAASTPIPVAFKSFGAP